jgi:hypothetical protein
MINVKRQTTNLFSYSMTNVSLFLPAIDPPSSQSYSQNRPALRMSTAAKSVARHIDIHGI